MTEKAPHSGARIEWTECLPPSPEIGATVQTACGGTIQYCTTTPCVVLNGQRVFFCLPICKADFEADPYHSCAALNPSTGCR